MADLTEKEQQRITRLREDREALQRRWMQQRQAEMDREAVMAEMAHTAPPPESLPPPRERDSHGGATGHGWRGGGNGPRPEEVIDKLTERLTVRLRDELRVELQRETADACKVAERQGKKLEGFLANEIESHTCPICLELMVAPAHSPNILFPCGHSFCAECLRRHKGSQQRTKCPLCRQDIASHAVNHSLQEIIQQFVQQRERVMSGQTVSNNRREPNNPSSAGPNPDLFTSFADVDDGDGEDDALSSYRRQYRTIDIRCRILRNELADSKDQSSSAALQVNTARAVLKHMRDEEGELRARMKQLAMEIEVVQGQVQDQERKVRTLEDDQRAAGDKCELIANTLTPLEQECEKLRVLVHGLEQTH